MKRLSPPNRKYELLIKGGRVIDPSQSLNTVTDIAVNVGKVVAISPNIDSKEAVPQLRCSV